MPEGLVNQAQAPAPAMPPGSAAPMPPGMTGAVPTGPETAASPAAMAGAGPGNEPTPDEQAAYDSAMDMASEIIYVNDESSAKIADMLGTSKPAEAISNIVGLVLGKIEEAFSGELPETVVMPVADEITDVIVDLGQEVGAFQLSEDQVVQVKGQVVQMLLAEYGVEEADVAEVAQGVPQEEIDQYAQVIGGQ